MSDLNRLLAAFPADTPRASAWRGPRLKAIVFSWYTCLPAWMASTKCRQCRCWGVAIKHTVQALVLEHLPVVHVRLHAGNVGLCLLQPLRIDIAYSRELSVRAIDCFARDLAASIAVADDAEPDTIVCTENCAGNSGKAPNAGSHLAKECTSGTH